MLKISQVKLQVSTRTA